MKRKFTDEEKEQILKDLESAEDVLIITSVGDSVSYSIHGNLAHLIGGVCDDNIEFYNNLKLSIIVYEAYKNTIN